MKTEDTTKPIPRNLTISYYDGEEVGRAELPKVKEGTVAILQWHADHLKIPYQCLCITEWDGEEIIAQMSLREAVDSNLTTALI